MAKSVSEGMESNLQSMRDRLLGGSVDGAFYDTSLRLWTLRKSLEGIGASGDSELCRYFPVASIAVLESHFKATVAAMVDAGSPYLERGLQLAKERLKSAVDVVPLLHRKSATIGELVGHVLPFSSVSNLENTFCALFNEDFKALVANVKDPYHVRNEWSDAQPVVSDVAALWRALSRAFERRHILAHEAATNFAVSFEDASSDIDSCALVSAALDAIMWATVWRNEPLTQYEMNVAAWKRCKAVRVALAARIRLALTIATADGERARFRQMHVAWRTFTKQWLSWEGEPFAMGSIQPMLRAISQERAMTARLETIEGWIGLMRPESRSSKS